MRSIPLGAALTVLPSSTSSKPSLGLKVKPSFCPSSSFLPGASHSDPSLSRSGVCGASQVVDLFPAVSPEVVVREARIEDCWEVAETHCSSFFPDYSFPLDFVLRVDRLLAMLAGFSVPAGCKRTCLVAVIGSSVDDTFSFSYEDLKVGRFDGKFCLNKGYVTGILTVDTIADFLPRRGPLRQRRWMESFSYGCNMNLTNKQLRFPYLQENAARVEIPIVYIRTGIAYISNVAVREKFRRKGIAKRLIAKAETQARRWGCRAIALHCDFNNPGATKLYKSQGFKCIQVPEGANWPHPKTSPDVRFNFMMKLLNPPCTT